MSGRSGDRLTVNSRTRFSCSDRTPTMKKLPRPTASSTMRAWLPGRLSCSTAWRSGNQRRAAPAAESRGSARCRPGAARARRRRTRRRRPRRCAASRPARPSAPIRPASTTARRPRSAPRPDAARADSARSSSEGLTWRTSSSGTSENSSDDQQADAEPLQRPPRIGERVADDDAGRRRGGERRRNRARSPRPRAARRSALPARPSATTWAM